MRCGTRKRPDRRGRLVSVPGIDEDPCGVGRCPGFAKRQDKDVKKRQSVAGVRRGVFGRTDRGQGRRCRPFGPDFAMTESLGGVESLIAHPATMTHAAMSAAAGAVVGIG